MAERNIKKMSIRELAFALTQHADDLQLFANGISEDAADDFAQTEAAIMEIIYELYARYGEKGIPMDWRTRQYLDKIKRRIAEIRENLFNDETEELTKQSREVVKNEGKFLKAFFIALTGAAAIGLDAEWYDRISKYGIYGGNTVRQIMEHVAAGDIDRIYTAVIDGLQNGKSIDEIRETVRKEMEKTSRFTKSEIVSIINGAANDAALAFATVNKTKLMYSAVLDDKVCEECSSLDWNIYNYDDSDIPSVPRHNNCRCRLIPVADKSKENKKLVMSFENYILSLPESEQRKRLGPAIFDLWKAGKINLGNYVYPHYSINISEMSERGKTAFKKIKQDLNPYGYMEFSGPITEKPLESLRRYTCGEDGMYTEINRYMQAGGNQKNKLLDRMIADINSVLRVSTLKQDLVVYRGMKSRVVFNALKSGEKEILIDSFQSTSIDRKVSEGYAGNEPGLSILMKTILPKGTHCVDVSKISTARKKEEEILLNPTGKYTITSVYYNENSKVLEVEAIYER